MNTREDEGRGDDESDDFLGGDLEFEADRDQEIVTIPCPHCREPIWEEAVACEHCGRYLSQEDQPWWRPWWMIAGTIACLLCILFWMLRR